MRIEIEWLRIWTKYETIWNDRRPQLESIRFKRKKLNHNWTRHNRNSTGCRRNSSDRKTRFARLEQIKRRFCTISMSYRHNLRKFNILLIDYKLRKRTTIWIV